MSARRKLRRAVSNRIPRDRGVRPYCTKHQHTRVWCPCTACAGEHAHLRHRRRRRSTPPRNPNRHVCLPGIATGLGSCREQSPTASRDRGVRPYCTKHQHTRVWCPCTACAGEHAHLRHRRRRHSTPPRSLNRYDMSARRKQQRAVTNRIPWSWRAPLLHETPAHTCAVPMHCLCR